MTYTDEQIDSMMGISDPFPRAGGPEIKLGKDGKFYLDGSETPVELADPKIVILRVRRKLAEFSGREYVRGSYEYDAGGEVTLTGSKETDNESGIRKMYPGLKLSEAVYALLLSVNEPKVVKLQLSGSALGAGKEVPLAGLAWYDYLNNLAKGEGRKVETRLLVEEKTFTEESGAEKRYFAMRFEKGAALDEATIALAAEEIVKIAEKVENKKQKYASDPAQTVDKSAGGSEIVYPEEDIKLSDIPF